MIRKRLAVGRLFTPSQEFMITEWGFIKIGTEDATEIDKDADVYYYPRPGVLKIEGSYVYKEFITPQEIYVYVEVINLNDDGEEESEE